MFSLITTAVGFGISFVYPLYRTYDLLKAHKDPLVKDLVQNISGQVSVPKQRMELLEECIAYWALLALGYFVGSIRLVAWFLSLTPFSSLVLLYFQAWLVFPLVDQGPSQPRVTGTHVVYRYYLYRWLGEFCSYLDLYTEECAQRYNALIDHYGGGPQGPISFMKVRHGSSNEDGAVVPSAAPVSFGRAFSDMLRQSVASTQEGATGAVAGASTLAQAQEQEQAQQAADTIPGRTLLDSVITPVSYLTKQAVAAAYGHQKALTPSAHSRSSSSIASQSSVDGFEMVDGTAEMASSVHSRKERPPPIPQIPQEAVQNTPRRSWW